MQRFRRLLLLLLACMLLPVMAVQAGNNDNPPPLPGWTHSPAFSVDTPQRHGIVLSGGQIVRSSPVIAEIDGNAQNGREVAVGGVDGMLYVYGSDGGLRWSTNVQPAPCTVNNTDSKLSSTPAVGQLAGFGVPYVVVGYGSVNPSDCDGGVVAYDGRNGNLSWRFSLRAWAQNQGYTENLHGVASAPALADTDGDGTMEIGFGGFDRNVYLLNADGSVRWYYHAADTVWSSPAFVDINGDRRLEMIIGTDIAANPNLTPPTSDGGYVYAFDTRQRPFDALRVNFQPGALADPIIWRTAFDQAIFSSPSIGDVLPGNAGMEIVIGSGCFFPAGFANKNGKWIKILRLSDGAVLQTLNTNADCVISSPALGDIDDDGKLEVVATVGDLLDTATDKSFIMAWDPDENANPQWSTTPFNPISPPGDIQGNDEDGGSMQSAVIADLDGNGSLEVLAANFWSVHVLNGRDGAPLTCQNDQCGAQLSLFTWGMLKSTPAVGDLNGDGRLDVVIGGMHATNGGKGMLYSWTGFANLLKSPPGAQAASSAPWPMFRGNPRHTAVYPSIKLPSAQYSFLIEPQQSPSYSLTLTDGEGGTINWSVVEDDPSNVLTLNRTSGTSAEPLVMTVNGQSNAALGSYNATLTVQSPGLPSTGIAVAVTVVEEVFAVQVPVVLR